MKHHHLHKELKKVNKDINRLSRSVPYPRKTDHSYGIYALGIALLLALGAGIIYFGPEVTGFVTFSESVVKVESESFSITESRTIEISTDLDNINTIMLSGAVQGKGKAAVFLVTPEKKYLAYYFEGDADSAGTEFKDMCYDTCHIDGLGSTNTLEFQLSGTTIDIDLIKYIYGRLIDFTLEPLIFNIDYKTKPATIIDLKLTNNELTDYTVLLYVDGPLSDSFSWQGSLIHMTSDQPELSIPITVKLPSNLPAGEYTHKITARYVPPDTHDFIGESPVAETFVTVYN